MATTNTQAVPLRTKRGISAGSIFSDSWLLFSALSELS